MHLLVEFRGTYNSQTNSLRYDFEYDETDLPPRHSYKQDIYGYYSSNSTHYVPDQYFHADVTLISRTRSEISSFEPATYLHHFDFSDRNVNIYNTGAGILSSIIFPTGGKVSYIYQNNEFSDPDFVSTNQYGPGLRIYKIYNSDATFRSFEYVFSSLSTYPNFVQSNVNLNNYSHKWYMDFSSYSTNDVSNGSGSVYYQRVKEVNGIKGHIEYNFYNPGFNYSHANQYEEQMYVQDNLPGVPMAGAIGKGAILSSKITRDINNNNVLSEIYNYSFPIQKEIGAIRGNLSFYFDPDTDLLLDDYWTYSKYKHQSTKIQLDNKYVIYGNNGLITEQNFTYGNSSIH